LASYVFKIVVVGDYGVGKTTSITKFVKDIFKADYVPTLGVHITKKSFDINRDNVDLMIWDLAGQDRFAMVRQRFYDETDGIFIVYDITRRSSLENVKNWHNEVLKYTKAIPIILVGNKIDLIDRREVNNDDVMKLLQENNININLKLETSAKSGENIEEAFHSLVIFLIKKHSAYQNE